MSTSSIAGSGTSDALNQLVAQFTQEKSKPITTLQNKKEVISSRESTYNTVKSKLSSLQSIVENIMGISSSSSISTLAVQTATVSDTDILDASGDGTAVNTTHSIQVSQLAKSDTALTARFTKSATDLATTLGAGTKEFKIGDTAIDITINATDTNDTILNTIAKAVNFKDLNIRASVVADTATTSKLIFTSTESGSENAISMSETGNGNNLLASLGLTADVLSGRTTGTSTTAGFLYSDA